MFLKIGLPHFWTKNCGFHTSSKMDVSETPGTMTLLETSRAPKIPVGAAVATDGGSVLQTRQRAAAVVDLSIDALDLFLAGAL